MKKSTPILLVECKLMQPLWRTVWRFLRKLKTESSHDPAISLLNIYPGKTLIQKSTCALFTIAKTWKQIKSPLTDEWIKMCYIYTVEYNSAIKNKIMPFSAT